jgi:hypothetical protein
MTQMVLRLPNAQKAELQHQAELENTTLSDLVRSVLDNYLQASSKKKTYTILSDLAKMAKNAPKSGPKDLSTSYKEYLYGNKSKHAK